MSAPAISSGQAADGRVAPRQKWLTGPFGASLAAALVFLVAWQLAGTFGERIPGPIPVVNAAISEIERGEFFYNFAISMQRFAIGMALSIIVGVALGIAIGSSRIFDNLFGDVNLVGLAIPAVIWALLCTMWFGFADTAPIVTVILSAVPFVVVNVAAGARSVPPDLLDMSQSYDVPRIRRLRHAVLPAVTGYVVAGIRFGSETHEVGREPHVGAFPEGRDQAVDRDADARPVPVQRADVDGEVESRSGHQRARSVSSR